MLGCQDDDHASASEMSAFTSAHVMLKLCREFALVGVASALKTSVTFSKGCALKRHRKQEAELKRAESPRVEFQQWARSSLHLSLYTILQRG